MNWHKKFFALSLCVSLVVVACGKKEENGIPAPTDPNPTTPEQPIAPADPVDSRIPEQAKTATVLRGWNTLTGLGDIFGVAYSTVVGNPLVNLQATPEANSNISGEAFFLVETQDYAEWIFMPSFMGTWDGTSLDMIFADDAGIVRITGNKTNTTTLQGTITTRTRAAGENQCKMKRNCTTTWTWDPFSGTWRPQTVCVTDPNIYVDCQAYMAPANTQVKQVGTYIKTNVSEWIQ